MAARRRARRRVRVPRPEQQEADKAVPSQETPVVDKVAERSLGMPAGSKAVVLEADKAARSPETPVADKVAERSPEAPAPNKAEAARLPAVLGASKAVPQGASLMQVRRARRTFPTVRAIPIRDNPARLARSGTSVNVPVVARAASVPARSMRRARLARRALHDKSGTASESRALLARPARPARAPSPSGADQSATHRRPFL
jgi:hypothetical protein